MPFVTERLMFCKNIFLCNRQQTQFYLMIMQPHTPFRTAVVSKALGVSRLSFAPESALEEQLHLHPGAVSPLGLHFDDRHTIVFCYERAIRNFEEIAFHPCDNTATVVFGQDTFWDRVVPALGVTPIPLDLALV